MFEYKDWTRIEPCVCGRLMHVPEAIYCSWCGRKLATEHDEATGRLILQIADLKDAFEVWKAERQPQDEAAGSEIEIEPDGLKEPEGQVGRDPNFICAVEHDLETGRHTVIMPNGCLVATHNDREEAYLVNMLCEKSTVSRFGYAAEIKESAKKTGKMLDVAQILQRIGIMLMTIEMALLMAFIAIMVTR